MSVMNTQALLGVGERNARTGEPAEVPGMREMTRDAYIRWLDHPPGGVARVLVGDGAFPALPMSTSGGHGDTEGAVPSELFAAAYGGLLATFVAFELAHRGTPADELTVHVSCDLVGWALTARCEELRFHVTARSHSLDLATLEAATHSALQKCITDFGFSESSRISLESSVPEQYAGQ